METGARFESLKKLYSQRGLALDEQGGLSTPGGHSTGRHLEAKWEGEQAVEVMYKSKNPHDLGQVYAIKGGWTSNYAA